MINDCHAKVLADMIYGAATTQLNHFAEFLVYDTGNIREGPASSSVCLIKLWNDDSAQTDGQGAETRVERGSSDDVIYLCSAQSKCNVH